jgi:hypothetical protein
MTARRLLPAAIAALLSLVLACGGGGGADGGGGSANTWVGKVDGTDAYIALMSKEATRLVFVTDGKDLTLFFRGDTGLTDPNAFYTLRDNDNHIINVRAPQGSTYTGIITLEPGKNLTFTATPAKGEAGLYRAKEGNDQSNWVVLEDATFRGAKTTPDGKVEALTVRGGTKWTDAQTDP